MKKHKKLIIVLSSIFGIVLMCFLAMIIYLTTGIYRANIDPSVLKSDENVTVKKDDDYISFIPSVYSNGIIFYPGAKVEETAYAPMLRKIAESGVLCVVARMPFDLAIFDIDAAEDIIEDFDNKAITWYISGHSLGGAMASSYATHNKHQIHGVILFAAYSTSNISDLDVLSIYGSLDSVLNKEKYQDSLKNYPANFKEVIIEGGNHANFAYYGEQKGDGKALIPKEEQIDISTKSVLEFIK